MIFPHFQAERQRREVRCPLGLAGLVMMMMMMMMVVIMVMMMMILSSVLLPLQTPARFDITRLPSIGFCSFSETKKGKR